MSHSPDNPLVKTINIMAADGTVETQTARRLWYVDDTKRLAKIRYRGEERTAINYGGEQWWLPYEEKQTA